MEDYSTLDTPLDMSVKLCKTVDEKEYASIVGLLFAAFVTRPDIMCAAGQLSQFLNNPSSKHLATANRVLRYLKGTTTFGMSHRQCNPRAIRTPIGRVTPILDVQPPDMSL